MEKASEPALEKVEGQVRRSRRAKHGKKELLLVKEGEEEDPLENGKAAKQSLEKDSRERDAQLAAAPTASLEKDTNPVSLKPDAKNPPKAKLTPAAKPLEKGNICVVDWRNTLEVRDVVPPEHIKALRELCKVCKEVHILSYVESSKREKQVKQDAYDFLPKDLWERAKVHVTYSRTGAGGKMAWCKDFGVNIIFDDSPEIIQECYNSGLMAFAICTKWCKHGNLPQSMVFDTFAQAVECYFDL